MSVAELAEGRVTQPLPPSYSLLCRLFAPGAFICDIAACRWLRSGALACPGSVQDAMMLKLCLHIYAAGCAACCEAEQGALGGKRFWKQRSFRRMTPKAVALLAARSSLQSWLLTRSEHGTLTVDEGAASALVDIFA